MSLDKKEYSKISELEKKLFRKNNDDEIETRKADLRPIKDKVPAGWQEAEKKPRKKRFNFNLIITGVFVLALVFFIAVAILAFWAFSRDYSVFSNSNIDINFRTPAMVKAGDRVAIRINVVNRNNIALNNAILTLSLPEDSRSPEDITQSLTVWEKELGDLQPGEMRNMTAEVAFFGGENEIKDFHADMEYRVAGSHTPFIKRSSHQLTISTPPVSIFVDLVPEVVSGQEIVLEAKAVSNSSSLLQDVVLDISYPRGFVFNRSEPPASVDNNFWRLGDLPAGGERNLKIYGVITGQEEEVKPFQFRIGLGDGSTDIKTVLGDLFSSTAIKQSFLGAHIIINNSSLPEVVVSPNSQIEVNIDLVNNLQEELLDNRLELSLAGQAINDMSVRVDGGIYRASERTIFWDKRTFSPLATMLPAAREKIGFRFNLSSLTAPGRSPYYNPTIDLNLIIAGRRIAEGFPDEEIEIDLQRTIKINSDFRATARALYTQGPFVNQGPLPPRIDRETTYTIVWALTNSSNKLNNVEVRGSLPAYVDWQGVVYPEDENVVYNDNTGEIIWKVDELAAGVGFTQPTREMFFQVFLRPTTSHLDKEVDMVQGLSYKSFDTFTETNLSDSLRNINTNLIAEPGFERDWASVAR